MSSGRKQYPFSLIEPKWQQFWEEQQSFRAFNPGETIPSEHPFAKRHGLEGKKVSAADLPPKFYVLDMFPYPSGAGLHVGHPEGYTATDILARYKRAAGLHVLHPMGWDAFGLPAEQYAIKTGQHPRQTTEANIANFTKQIKSLGFSYDWTREVDTTDPKYFRWTQWIFLKLYNSWFNPETNRAEPIETLPIPNELLDRRAGESKSMDREPLRRVFRDSKRLAYVSDAPVWWCEALGTVLANEEVIDGKSEVGGFPAVKKPMRQWMLRITAYAEKLLNDLNTIDWSDSLKQMQRNWIGKSEGADVDFQVFESAETIRVFTTRPDTLFGATYMVLSPEHPLAQAKPYGIVPSEWPKNCPWQYKSNDPREVVSEYKRIATTKSDLERTELSKEKTGVFTGAYAVNPMNNEKIPIWIADYVLASYGTGAIMAVPAHDERDFEFAQQYGLPIQPVVIPSDEWLKAHVSIPDVVGVTVDEFKQADLDNPAQMQILAENYAEATNSGDANYCEECVRLFQKITCTGDATPDELENLRFCYEAAPACFKQGDSVTVFDGIGILRNSGPFDGKSAPIARKEIVEFLDHNRIGKKNINYKLRDWLFSRQRYWGEPFPIVWKKDANGNAYHEALPESALPLLPPVLDDYKPTPEGQPPLARAQDWVNLPDGSVRETNTMPQWAGSCWYYLRFLDAQNPSAFVGSEVERYWMDPASKTPGVNLYVGGTEHAVLHLLYARFWHKVLFDLGYVSTPEPFFKLVNQGLILGEDGQKMSKSRGNVINPDDILIEYGADAFRLYEMFMGPLEMVKPWNTKGVEGVYRFLGRVWRLFVDETSEVEFEQALTTAEAQRRRDLLELIKLNSAIQKTDPTKEQLKVLHTAIKKVTEDLDGLRFNTAISAMMVFVNDALAWPTKPVAVLREFLILLQPFAPHIAEELWSKLHSQFALEPSALAYAPWPKFNPALLVEDTLEIPVQVNGKLRDVIRVPATATQQEIESTALKAEKAQPFIAGKTVKKTIIVPKKLVNIVVG